MAVTGQALEFPRSEILPVDVWPEEEGNTVEFRLVYKGRLPAEGRGGGGGRNAEKHEIRLAMHEQLRALWREHPSLREWARFEQAEHEGSRSWPDILADNYQRCNMRFVPLVTNKAGLACALDILFLRRDPPGSPIINGGDIDNRLKVLLDGLKMPKECSQIPPNWRPGPDQDPLYCLMEDDNLITEIKVTSDRLLVPIAEDEHRNSVELVIHVTTKIVNGLATFSVGGAPVV
jgi:hypothetical protein